LPEAFGKKLVRKRIEEARAAGRLTVGQSKKNTSLSMPRAKQRYGILPQGMNE
jgi:hypothetical protein